MKFTKEIYLASNHDKRSLLISKIGTLWPSHWLLFVMAVTTTVEHLTCRRWSKTTPTEWFIPGPRFLQGHGQKARKCSREGVMFGAVVRILLRTPTPQRSGWVSLLALLISTWTLGEGG